MGRFWFILFASALAYGYPVSELKEVQNATCAKEATKLIQRWIPNPQWTAHGLNEDNSKVFKTPGKKTGVWVELHAFLNGKIELYRISEQTKTRVTFKKENCVPRIVTSLENFDEKLLENQFTDATLLELFSKVPAGIFYAWSPHMPYSIKGMKPILAAANKLRLPVFFLLDPNADLEFSMKEGKKARVPQSAYRRIESVELLNRQMVMHFPSILLFKDSKIVGPLFPGVKDALTYEAFIQQYMGSH